MAKVVLNATVVSIVERAEDSWLVTLAVGNDAGEVDRIDLPVSTKDMASYEVDKAYTVSIEAAK